MQVSVGDRDVFDAHVFVLGFPHLQGLHVVERYVNFGREVKGDKVNQPIVQQGQEQQRPFAGNLHGTGLVALGVVGDEVVADALHAQLQGHPAFADDVSLGG